MNRRCLVFALLLCLLPVSGQSALHLMFPYDYLSLGDDERRFYLLGVLDARLAPFVADDRLEWRSRCIEQRSLNGIQDVLEKQVIPSPETASIPMPYLVERALTTACGGPRGKMQ